MTEEEKKEMEALRAEIERLKKGQEKEQEGTTGNAQEEGNFDWQRIFMRKDRPLPKVGCSWAFYLFLLMMIVVLVLIYIFIYI